MPHVACDPPPAQKPVALQHPPHVSGPQGGAAAASMTATSGAPFRHTRVASRRFGVLCVGRVVESALSLASLASIAYLVIGVGPGNLRPPV